VEITKVVTFDAAHRLPNYAGKCSNLHGHRWTLHVTLSGPLEVQSGFVMDFGRLEDIIEQNVLKPLDHHWLNQVVENPTCEHLIIYIGRLLKQGGLPWSKLRLEESPGSWCEMDHAEYEILKDVPIVAR